MTIETQVTNEIQNTKIKW